MNAPATIPASVAQQGRTMNQKLGRFAPWWQRDIPAHGIPVRFNGGGTIKAGISGWIIDGHARRVFLGEDNHEATVGEFIVLTDGGSQVLAQVGRDFDFISDAPKSAGGPCVNWPAMVTA